MPKTLLPLVALLACLAPAAPALAQDSAVPTKQVLYHDGPTNRYLMGGQWLFRMDSANQGLRQGYMKQAATTGWTPTTVPNAWNAQDQSPESMRGTVAWYRKDFKLPSSSRRYDWSIRFESVNYRSRVWINGKRIGTNRGAYLPFEFRIPRSYLKRGGMNHLVVRVENIRKTYDLPPSGFTRTSVPTGGWWNYGGILREVYLKRVDRVDWNTVQVLPDLPCRTCDAKINFRVTVRNFSDAPEKVSIGGTFGRQTVRFPKGSVGARKFGTFRTSITVKSPHLWSPKDPHLYSVNLRLRAGAKVVDRYTLKSGVRSIKVAKGRVMLNGLPVSIRGVAIHEDDKQLGFAINNQIRNQYMAEVKALGATMIRSHYPLHPYFEELADRLGILVWSEIPMYALKTDKLKSEIVRKTGANELRDNVLANGNHPSVVVWSVGNELSARPGPVQGAYLARAAKQARELDPTRLIGYAVAGYPGAGCQSEYAPLDIVGINDYFGWYPGPNGQIADRTTLSEYLDSVRTCYPDKGIMITEFGAEANRHGPPEEKGTYEFQSDFINYHMGVFASKPWLSGAIYFALKEFRVRPEWDGGNPRPTPPIHQKGVIDFDGNRKPGFADLQRDIAAVDQYPGQPVAASSKPSP